MVSESLIWSCVLVTSLQFEFIFVHLKVHEGLSLVCLPFHVREDVKEYDIHIKLKFYMSYSTSDRGKSS